LPDPHPVADHHIVVNDYPQAMMAETEIGAYHSAQASELWNKNELRFLTRPPARGTSFAEE
jgi:hypothetical protein